MRKSPTSRYSVWIVAGGVALVGCAASGEDGEDDDTPTTELPARERKTDSKPDAPKFEANIPGDVESEGDGSAEDPAPEEGDQCIDNGDPAPTAAGATQLPPISDCNNDMQSLTGTMKGAVDVDYYKLSASDDWGCSIDADFQAETAGTELCVFMRCKNSTVDAVTGCAQGVPAESETGLKGCCAAAPGHAVPKWDCEGWTDNDSADIQFRVRQINGNKCLPYKVNYRF